MSPPLSISSSSSAPFTLSFLKRSSSVDDLSSSPTKKSRVHAGGDLSPPFGLPEELGAAKLILYLSESLPLEIPVKEPAPLDEKLKNTFYKAVKDRHLDPTAFPFDASPGTGIYELRITAEARQGVRNSMQDAHFHQDLGDRVVLGICDGHGVIDPKLGDTGKRAADFAVKKFQEIFPDLIEAHPDAWESNFKRACEIIHEAIPLPTGGTTALFACFDKSTHFLYAATLADTEAFVFYKDEQGVVRWAPLSPIKNWCHPKEEARAKPAFSQKLWPTWTEINNPKHRYFPPEGPCINVSRSLGDKNMIYQGIDALKHTPTVSAYKVPLNAYIVVYCDGVGDVLTPQVIADKVITPLYGKPGIERAIANLALQTSTDNITILCAETTLDEPESSVSTQPLEPASDS